MCDNQAERDMNFLSYVRDAIADGAKDKFFTVGFVGDIMEAVDRIVAERDEAKKEIKSLENLLEDYRDDLNAYQWREDNLE